MLSRNSAVDFDLNQHISIARTITPKLSCSLRWRQGKLWVGTSVNVSRGEVPLPAFASEQWFQACLARSQAKAVCIDPNLGQATISIWAKACQKAGKPLYLRIPSTDSLPQKRHRLTWWLKRSCDFSAALLLVVVLTPIMLLMAGLIKLQDGGPIFYAQWRVGERGKLFRLLKFRSMVEDAEALHHRVMSNQQGLHKLKDDPRVTPIGKWIRKFSLDEIPQLFNVLRGEMSLVGPRPWAVYDALRIAPELRCRLNALPGITGQWQVESRSNELNINVVNHQDLTYLQQWNLLKDLKFLLLTPSKVITGNNAY